jgi:ribosomal protein S19
VFNKTQDVLLRKSTRSMIIPNLLYKKRAGVYNGKKIIFFSIKHSMLGKKFGEFSITKSLGPLVRKKKKKKK